MLSRPIRVRPTIGAWTLALGLIAAAGLPATAEEPRSYADLLLKWPGLDRDAESGDNPDSEAEGREEFIETDRNSFTFTPFTPGSGRLIVESAYSYIGIGQEGAKHSFPETVFRYGIGDRLELRLGYNYETGRPSEAAEGDIVGNFGINAEQQILYGFKYAVTRQRPAFRLSPNSTFLAQAHTPVGSVEGQTQMRLGYVCGWVLPNSWTFESALRFGTDREGFDNYNIWAPSTVLKVPFGREKRWFTHVEYFGLMSQGKEHDYSKQLVDSGLHYLITPNWEVGAVVAFGINEQTRGTLVNVGFGVRF
jgi:hypothetical protein